MTNIVLLLSTLWILCILIFLFLRRRKKTTVYLFLAIWLTRPPDKALQRDIYHKATWDGSYLQFSSFTPVAYERASVRTHFYRVQETTKNQVQEEEFIKRTLLAEEYSENFIDQHRRQRRLYEKPVTVPFKGGHLFNQNNINLKSVGTFASITKKPKD